MDISFVKGFILSGSIFLGWKLYSDFKYISVINEAKLDELERRIENLEDFRLRFYQLYSSKDSRAWTLDTDDEYTDEDDEDEEISPLE